MQTTSSGTGSATNNSSTYHYKGELKCVTTCPGPEPQGCSVTDTMIKPWELGTGGTVSCIMLPTTDPCCNDDGDFFLGARFTAGQYRTSSSNPWTDLATIQTVVNSDLEEDAAPPTHQPNKGKAANFQDIQLTATCAEPPSIDEAKVELKNGSKQHVYLARQRAQVVCPSGSNDPNTFICGTVTGCDGFQNEYPFPAGCQNLDPNNDPNTRVDGNKYPMVYDPNLDDRNPTQATDPNFEGEAWECEPDPNNPAWVWCTAVLLPEETVRPRLVPLNSCCDCQVVERDIVCGEVDTMKVRNPGDPNFYDVTDTKFDKVRRCEASHIPAQKRQLFDCFATDPNVICNL